MLERSRIWSDALRGLAAVCAACSLALAGCATAPPEGPASPAAEPVVVKSPAPKAAADPRALEEEARALLAQAETDVQRARARRALWTKAWEALVGARAALAGGDSAATIRLAGRASELAQLGLEQLAYPAVRVTAAADSRTGTNGPTEARTGTN
jgi:hypothetical protein